MGFIERLRVFNAELPIGFSDWEAFSNEAFEGSAGKDLFVGLSRYLETYGIAFISLVDTAPDNRETYECLVFQPWYREEMSKGRGSSRFSGLCLFILPARIFLAFAAADLQKILKLHKVPSQSALRKHEKAPYRRVPCNNFRPSAPGQKKGEKKSQKRQKNHDMKHHGQPPHIGHPAQSRGADPTHADAESHRYS